MGVNTEKGATYALRKLRGDANDVWMASAEKMIPIIRSADDLELGEEEFSWMAEEAGIVEQYKNAWNVYRKLLNEAGSTMNDIANNLLKAADNYERTEQENAAALQDVASRLED